MFSARDRVRFWSKCEPVAGGCIEWRGSTTGSGYGHFHHDGRLKLAHHVAYELCVGPVPDLADADCRGTCLLHRCDNRLCVEPTHLTPGTHLDNMRDMDAKGRRVALPGELNPRAKLTPEQVAEIRRLKGVESQRSLGRRFGVSKNTIAFIHRGTHWRQFPEVRHG